jgi:hypothetical protein
MFGLVANENNDLPGAFDETDVEPDGRLIRPVHGGLLSVVNYEGLLLKQTRIQKIGFPSCAPGRHLIATCTSINEGMPDHRGFEISRKPRASFVGTEKILGDISGCSSQFGDEGRGVGSLPGSILVVRISLVTGIFSTKSILITPSGYLEAISAPGAAVQMI